MKLAVVPSRTKGWLSDCYHGNDVSKGALVVATTHYGEIKRFAQEHDDFVPAAMAFDRETLTPKYQLKIGEVGDSQALWIARKMKMEPQLIERRLIIFSGKNTLLIEVYLNP